MFACSATLLRDVNPAESLNEAFTSAGPVTKATLSVLIIHLIENVNHPPFQVAEMSRDLDDQLGVRGIPPTQSAGV